jgi:endonuclease YncB( thermonuclease family)
VICVRAIAAIVIAFAAVTASAQEIVPPAVRNVTPPGITPGPVVDGPLVREPTPPKPPEPARWRRYVLPATTDAATFFIDRRLTIHIAGVTPPAVDATCTFADGSAWPCGRIALNAFRLFLAGRPVECYFPPIDAEADVTAPCRIGKTDLGTWLLRNGWARTNELATDAYLSASAEAHCANLGIWKDTARPDYCPPRAVSQPEPATTEPAVAQPNQADRDPWLSD